MKIKDNHQMFITLHQTLLSCNHKYDGGSEAKQQQQKSVI